MNENTSGELKKQNITYSELEAIYGIKKATAHSLVCTKRIPHIRLGGRYVMFRVSEIDAWLSAHSVPVRPKI